MCRVHGATLRVETPARSSRDKHAPLRDDPKVAGRAPRRVAGVVPNQSRAGSPHVIELPKELETQARETFAARFGGEPEVVAVAPSRVELLGNHTDYNGGLVLAAAIDRHTVVVGRALTASRDARVHAVNLNEDDAFAVDAFEPTAKGSWSRYVRGVLWALSTRCGPPATGFEAVIVGDVPLGAGLSSSASLQAAEALFLIASGVIPSAPPFDRLDSKNADEADNARVELAKTLQRSENEFVGVASGLLDQFTVILGRRDHALFLDCATAAHSLVPLGSPAPAIVVCDSGTSRQLADGMYNRRRAESDRIVEYFAARRPRPGAGDFLLSFVALDDLNEAWDKLDPIGRRRARHVLTENERVQAGVEALRRGDAAELGRLLCASHSSSRDDFENSSPALDALIESAAKSPGFLGGKLSGAGWAGCTVNLVDAESADDFAASVTEHYRTATGNEATVHVLRAAAGAAAARATPKLVE